MAKDKKISDLSDAAPKRLRDVFMDLAKTSWVNSVKVVRAVYAFLKKAVKWVRELVSVLVVKFLAMKRTTRMILVLVSSLSIFFLWQLMAYSVQQTTFVMVNLFMISLVSFAVCRIIIHNQNVLDEKKEELDDVCRVKEKQERELVKLKAELFEIRNVKSREDLIKDASDFMKVVSRQRSATPVGAPKYQFLLNAINDFYAKSGVGINSGVVYARQDGTNIFRAAGQFALVREPRAELTSDESIIGQVLRDGKKRLMDVPPEYLVAMSGLGMSATKSHVLLLPLHLGDVVDGVVELCSFNNLSIYDMWEDIDKNLQED